MIDGRIDERVQISRVIQPPFSVFYCAMRWKGWGGSTTTGLGVARIGFKQYGLRVKLSRVRWCRQWTVSYTRETAEIWGAGEEPQRHMGNVSPREAAKLRALIGRHVRRHHRTGCWGDSEKLHDSRRRFRDVRNVPLVELGRHRSENRNQRYDHQRLNRYGQHPQESKNCRQHMRQYGPIRAGCPEQGSGEAHVRAT